MNGAASPAARCMTFAARSAPPRYALSHFVERLRNHKMGSICNKTDGIVRTVAEIYSLAAYMPDETIAKQEAHLAPVTYYHRARKAKRDLLAVLVAYGFDKLSVWNCRHIGRSHSSASLAPHLQRSGRVGVPAAADIGYFSRVRAGYWSAPRGRVSFRRARSVTRSYRRACRLSGGSFRSLLYLPA